MAEKIMSRKLPKCICKTRKGIHTFDRCPRLLEMNRREREWQKLRERSASELVPSDPPSPLGGLFRVTPLKLKTEVQQP